MIEAQKSTNISMYYDTILEKGSIPYKNLTIFKGGIQNYWEKYSW